MAKKFTLLLCILVAAFAQVFSQCTTTNLSGNQVISSNTTWPAGLYNITGDFTVNAGATLIISASNGCAFTVNAVNINVLGTIVADGAGSAGGSGAGGGGSSGGAGGGSLACGGAGGGTGSGTGGGTAGVAGGCASGGCSINCGNFICSGGNDADRAGGGGGSGGAGGTHGGSGGTGGGGAVGRVENVPGNSRCGSNPVGGTGATGNAASTSWGISADYFNLAVGSGGGGGGGGGGGFNNGTGGGSGGNGGGSVNLNASGTLVMSGSISANGTTGGDGGNGGVRSGNLGNWNCENCGNSNGGGANDCRNASLCGACTYYTWCWPGGAGGGAGGGSGGGIKLEATGAMTVTGILQANGGNGGNAGHPWQNGTDGTCNNIAGAGGPGGGGVIKFAYNPCAPNIFAPTLVVASAGVPGTAGSGNAGTNTASAGVVMDQTANIYVPGYTPYTPLTINSNQTLCGLGNTPADLTSSVLSGGGGSDQYQWYVSTTTATGQIGASATPAAGWNAIGGATSFSLPGATMGALTTTTYYQLQVSSGPCNVWSNVVTITVDSLPSITDVQTTNQLCGGGANTGSITITATGGIPGYTYSTDGGSTYSNSNIFNNLAAASYTVFVSDAGNCNTSYSANPVVITAPAPLTLTASVVDASCATLSNGSVLLTAGGGVTPYLFTLNAGPNQSDSLFPGLFSGSYAMQVSDNNGCLDTVTAIVSDSTTLTASIDSQTNVTCFGAGNGAVTISLAGGVGSSTYSIDNVNFQVSPTFSQLAGGNYVATGEDTRGCKATVNVNISQGGLLSIQVESIVNIPCNNSPQGEIFISPSGGTPDYTFLWSTNDTSQNLAGLTATGTYSVTATDNNGCTGTTSANLQNDAPPATTVSTVDVTNCFGATNGSAWLSSISGGLLPYAINWSNGANTDTVTNIAGGTYVVIVTDANFCQSVDTVVINQPAAILIGLSTVQPSCNGTTDGSAMVSASGGASGFGYVWSTTLTADSIGGLAAGPYAVTVQDANSCTVDSSFTLVAPAALIDTIMTTDNNCFGGTSGTAQALVAGGTGPYTPVWSNGGSTTLTESNLAAGAYTVTLTDSHNCSVSAGFAISQPAQLVVTTSTSNATTGQNNGTATIDAITGGVAPYTATWSTGQTLNTIVNLAAGTYTVIVQDANGCTQADTVVVNQVTGISQMVEEISFNVYPNPAKTEITIELSTLNTETTLSIKNVLGEVAVVKTISALKTQINLAELAGGVYFVELTQGDKKTVKEVVVTK